ncbi:NUDIX hydrolase [Chryseobacterium shigense]|uniref:8-oxo-dGTP pyrophosphatase MutT (NUDIX family) n=1 Tax=Chryseobacterium shigense TaxID=297244 RepID=A0A841N7P9_9FLAO|nr:NUDIX domain-containing protein [Chryseobacterium shigense]MBB6372627.1 8-oxo-dGTP pyrophosphatase MutT (NUDIX family) [Chryseobacterium shigense]
MKNIIDKVALIHINNYKILSTISKSKDRYFLPGGKRENSETDFECLKREIFEELNVKLINDSITFFGCFEAPAYGHSDNVIVRMLCYFADFTGDLMPNNEIESFSWLEFKDKEKTSFVDQLIFDDLHSKGLIR